jgi:RNA polymerase sigma-70 factor (ECF subfamily)
MPWRIQIVVSAQSAVAIDLSDALLARARKGEEAALEIIYRRFERPIYTLALRMTGDPEEALEVLQNTMLRLIDKFSDFRGDSPFWGWLRQIAVNETLMRLRQRGRLLYTDDLPEPESDPADDRLPPAAADGARLIRALDRLPQATRSVLWLYHGEGYTHPEIAAMLGRTVSFSKSQLARGLARLRTELGVAPTEVSHHA